MQIVSQSSEADLARHRAMDQIDWALRDLAANVLRVIRGAGKPDELGTQAQAFIEALLAYRETAGHFPFGDELASALGINRDREFMEQMSTENRLQIYAEQAIIRGSLQIAASRLLGQNTQQTAGHHEMRMGVRDLQDAMDRQHEKWAATTKSRNAKIAIAKARSKGRSRSPKP